MTHRINPCVVGKIGGIALALAALSAPVGAQSLPLKRPALTPVAVACPVFQTPATPVREQIDEANRLATLGQESSLEGDHRAARDLFSQAAALDPKEASLAYRLAREQEALGQRQEAVHEYCRYLFLAPGASDAAQFTGRIAQLLPADVKTHGNDVVSAFQAGVVAFDARDWRDAITSFSKAGEQDTALTAAVYDRGVAHDQNGDAAAAIQDYSSYLRRDPLASDTDQVRARVDALRSSIPSPGAAFALGILPGGGEFYTSQPILGVVVAAGVAGGVVLALQKKTVTRDTMYPDPFGNGTYPGTYTQTQHPNIAIGAGVAGGVLLLGALEAEIVAHGRSTSAESADAAANRSAFLPHVGPMTVELPTLTRASPGLQWQFPVRITVQ
jgi:tetratricopeptide (TPR) repeat protein